MDPGPELKKPFKNTSKKIKKIIFFIGATALLYFSLYGSLTIRSAPWSSLFWPFTLIFALSLLVFFIAGLYDEQDKLTFYSLLWKSLAINTALAIFIFYLSSTAPKRILLFHVIIFALMFLF